MQLANFKMRQKQSNVNNNVKNQESQKQHKDRDPNNINDVIDDIEEQLSYLERDCKNTTDQEKKELYRKQIQYFEGKLENLKKQPNVQISRRRKMTNLNTK